MSAPRPRPPGALGILEIHHVAVAVRDLAEARSLYVGLLGLEERGAGPVPSQKVRVLFAGAGRSEVECLEPLGPDSTVARFLEKRGPGLHHLAYRVADLAAALAELKRRGTRLIDGAPRPGARGTRVAFVHPSATGGVLTELVEDGRP
ncbi:MAG TPA: methylmalonyl-CoA epimerase [Planctomycetota bacterium]|nr:methylmalonyl-CoA epimerase [Planctomycetota bacterium]